MSIIKPKQGHLQNKMKWSWSRKYKSWAYWWLWLNVINIDWKNIKTKEAKNESFLIYQKRDVQTKTAQLLVCIVDSEEDKRELDAMQLPKLLEPRTKNNIRTAMESNKVHILQCILGFGVKFQEKKKNLG